MPAIYANGTVRHPLILYVSALCMSPLRLRLLSRGISGECLYYEL